MWAETKTAREKNCPFAGGAINWHHLILDPRGQTILPFAHPTVPYQGMELQDLLPFTRSARPVLRQRSQMTQACAEVAGCYSLAIAKPHVWAKMGAWEC